MRIRTLFLLSFAGMFCVLAAISGLGIYSSLKQVRVIDDILEHPVRVATLSRDILSEVLLIRQKMKDLPHAGSAEERAGLLGEITRFEGAALRNLEGLSARYRGDPAELEAFRTHLAGWRELRSRIIGLLESGRRPHALEMIQTQGGRQVDLLEQDIRHISGLAEGRAVGLVSGTRDAQIRATRMLVTLCVLRLLAAILAVHRLTRRVVLPLGSIAAFAGGVAEGDYSRRVTLRRKDEFGEVGRTIDLMAERIEAHSRELEAKVEERTQELQAANQQLRASDQQLKASNQQLQAANQQLQASDQQLKAANQQLQAANQQLKASDEVLRATIQELRFVGSEQERFETLGRVLEGGVGRGGGRSRRLARRRCGVSGGIGTRPR